MKILYLHQYFATPRNSGGIRSYQFSRRLVESGHRVDVITSSAFLKDEIDTNFFILKKVVIDGINIHIINVPYSNKMRFFFRLLAFILFASISSIYILKFRYINLIYATSTPLSIGIPALIGSKLLRKKLIFEIRDMWPDIPISLGIISNKILISTLYYFENLIYKSSTKIVALSPGMKKSIIEKGVSSEKIITIPNGCDLEDFKLVSPTSNLEKYKLNKETKICLYAGTLGKVNDIPYIIKLAAEFERQKLNLIIIIIGDGSEKNHALSLSKQLNLTYSVKFLSPLSKEKLIPYIKAVDACISTTVNNKSLYDNSANKFFDSLAAGKPIFINYKGWQKNMIEESDLGLTLSRGIVEDAKEIDSFFSNRNLSELENKILDFAQKEFSRDILFKRLLEEAISQ